METRTRNAHLNDLLPLLAAQHDLKYDVVVPSSHLRYRGGGLIVSEGSTVVSEQGVSLVDAVLLPTREFEDQLGDRLDIPARYLRKMREADQFGLLDHNVNTWLEAAERNWLVRGFRPLEADEAGIARAFLSDRYQVVDHIDAVTAMLDGVVAAGVDPAGLEVTGDLSPSRMRVKVVAPEITAQAPEFLARYRNPTGPPQGPDGGIAAGLVMTNSETGAGAFQIAPQITVLICRNGMTRTVDAMRRVHLGGQMEAGVIDWSADTRRANIDLIRSQSSDAVQTFLSTDYLAGVRDELEDRGSKMLDRPHEVVDGIGKQLGYGEEERQAILDLFTRGGDTRAGGVVNAFTAFARDVEDPERAMDIEAEAFDILAMAARQ